MEKFLLCTLLCRNTSITNHISGHMWNWIRVLYFSTVLIPNCFNHYSFICNKSGYLLDQVFSPWPASQKWVSLVLYISIYILEKHVILGSAIPWKTGKRSTNLYLWFSTGSILTPPHAKDFGQCLETFLTIIKVIKCYSEIKRNKLLINATWMNFKK